MKVVDYSEGVCTVKFNGTSDPEITITGMTFDGERSLCMDTDYVIAVASKMIEYANKEAKKRSIDIGE